MKKKNDPRLLIVSDIGSVLINDQADPVQPINDKLSEFYDENKSTILLATDDPVGAALRARRMLNAYHKRDIFHDMISAQTFKLYKDNPDYWTALLRTYRYAANQVLFLDDRIENIDTARAFDIRSVHIQPKDMDYNVREIDQAYRAMLKLRS